VKARHHTRSPSETPVRLPIASTQPVIASTQPVIASTQPVIASTQPVTRRQLLRMAPAAAVVAPLVGVWVAACSKSEPEVDCSDLSALTPAELAMRSRIGYQSRAPKGLECDKCVHWIAGTTPTCGKCRVMPGPVDSLGYCRLFAHKG
jgi:hypothetical protein